MGKDWLYWGGSGGAGRSTKKGKLEGNNTPSGCMNAVFQLFDFHHFQFSFHHQVPTFRPDSFLPDEPTTLKGVEAPRNSLEMVEPFASFPSTMKGEETLSINPMSIQIKTRTDDLSSEFSSSPGSKTPNLVARLMGLDLLPPDSCSSTSSHSYTSNPPSKSLPRGHQTTPIHRSSSTVGSRNFFDTDIIGTRSLPETPRISSARRSDVEYHHRLSLQINRENIGVNDDLSGNKATKIARRRDQLLRQEDENRSPACKYARQIVKQVKENASRKVGLDITNTIRNREIKGRDDDGDDDRVVLLKAKKPPKGWESVGDESSPSIKSTLSSSLRLRKQNQVIISTHSPKLSQSPLSSSLGNAQLESGRVPVLKQKKSEEVALQNPDKKCKKMIAGGDHQSYSTTTHLRKHPNVYRNKQEEPYVRSSSVTKNRANLLDKKSKKTPLSSELLNTNVPTLFPVKKDPSSSSSPPKFPQKQSEESDALSSKRSPRLSSCSSRLTYNPEAKNMPTVQELISRYSSNGATSGGLTEFQYITKILKRTGINQNTPLSSTQWYSPSHPLNPSIFNHLEISSLSAAAAATTTTAKSSMLSHRCNRKLIFQLVDEILVGILKPYMNLKPWAGSVQLIRRINGSELIEKICTKIRSIPSADCRVLEDIDELIEKDLDMSDVRGSMALEEEGEAIVAEIEKDLVESLVHEIAVGVVVLGIKGNRV